MEDDLGVMKTTHLVMMEDNLEMIQDDLEVMVITWK